MQRQPRWSETPRHEVLQEAGAQALASVEDAALSLQAAAIEKENQKNQKRFSYAKVFIGNSIGWLVFLAAVLVLHGIESVKFTLPTSVLNALLVTTTINVLGPYFLIAKYLFNGNGKK